MQLNGNTILITGGGSGIGRGLAEAFHKLGNQVIISGRRKAALDTVTAANPGMRSETVDLQDADSTNAFAGKMAAQYPALNVVLHNAGVMIPEDVRDSGGKGVADAEAMIATNLMAPIRLNYALLPLLQKQPRATILTVSSGLAFVPLAMTPTYCATKAAIHSYSESLRYQLKKTNVEVIEIAPPYVQTELMGERQATDPRAMPLADFIAETMRVLADRPKETEALVERVLPLRHAGYAGRQKYEEFFQSFNDSMAASH